MEQTELYRPMNCIVCDKEIHQLYLTGIEQKWLGCWKDGTVGDIVMGYGSILDGNVYLICVCDECMANKSKEGKVDYLGEIS